MNYAQKDEIFNSTLQRIIQLNKLKAGEYASNSDALANFRQEAEDNNLSMETIWRVFANKHWRAISRFVADKQSGINRPSSEPIQGRIDDMIVYLLLLTCILNYPFTGQFPADAAAGSITTVTREELANFTNPDSLISQLRKGTF